MAETNLDDIMEAVMGINQKMDIKFSQIDQRFDQAEQSFEKGLSSLREEMNLNFGLIESKIDEKTTSRIVTLERR